MPTKPEASNGTCAVTTMNGPASCSEEMDGAWSLRGADALSWGRAYRSCRAGCLECANCAYVSVSLVDRECSWFAACDMARLQMRGEARFRTFFVPALNMPSFRLFFSSSALVPWYT